MKINKRKKLYHIVWDGYSFDVEAENKAKAKYKLYIDLSCDIYTYEEDLLDDMPFFDFIKKINTIKEVKK